MRGSGITITVVNYDSQFIHLKIHSHLKGDWICTVVYMNPKDQIKTSLWKAPKEFKCKNDLPRVVL